MEKWWNVDLQGKTEDTHSQGALLHTTVKYHPAPCTLTFYKSTNGVYTFGTLFMFPVKSMQLFSSNN
jgi:hypothetical protein